MKNVKGEGSIYPYRAGHRAYITVRGDRKYFYYPNTTAAEATKQHRDMLTQRDDGTLPKGKNYTVAVWMRHWLKTAKLKPGVLANYTANVERYIIPRIGNIKLRELEPEHLEDLYTRMLAGELSIERIIDGQKVKKPLSPRSVINVHSNIRRALKIAMQRGHVGRNVAALVEPPASEQADMKTLSESDAYAVLRAAEGGRNEARWWLGVVFGMRPAEVLGLTWEDIDIRNAEVKVRRQLQRIRGGGMQIIPSAKTSAGRRELDVPRRILDMLEVTRETQLLEQMNYGDSYVNFEFDNEPYALVFTQPNGSPIDIKVDTRRWHKLLDIAGLPHERRYIGRHTAASMMISMGIDVSVVAAMLGHSKTSFTYDTYVHPLKDKKRQAAKMLGNMYA
jgi:integrase